jgi:hypothetical protein
MAGHTGIGSPRVHRALPPTGSGFFPASRVRAGCWIQPAGGLALLGSRAVEIAVSRRWTILRRTSPQRRPKAAEQGAPALAGRIRSITAWLAQRARLPSRLVRRGAGASGVR